MLMNSGSVTVGTGTTLNLTNQANGITDVPAGSTLTVNGTLKAGSANGLAKLGSVEGTLNLGNGQATVDSGTLTVATGGSLALNTSGTTLTVTGALSDSGSVTVGSGTTLNLSGGMSNLAGQLFLENGKTTSITPSGGTLTLASGSTLLVSAGSGLTVNGSLTNKSTLETANGSGNKLTVTGNLTNGGSLFLQGSADTLTVNGTLTNNAGGTLGLDTSGDVANIGMLMNSGSVTVGTGTTLNLTNQANGITDVPAGSTLTVNGTLKAGSANGLAKLGSVEGTLNLGNGQATVDSGTLTVATGGSLALNTSGTTLTVTGALSDSGSVTVGSGTTLNLSGGMSNLAGQLFLENGKTTSITPSGGTLTLASGSTLLVSAGSGLTVNGSLTNKSTLETANGSGNTVTVNGGFTNSGSLFLLGSADKLTVTQTLTNNAGATLELADSGDVANLGPLSNAGTFNINADTATIKGTYTQSSTGALDISIGGTMAGQYDQLNVTTAKLNGTLNTTFINGFTPAVGQKFTIMNISSGSETGKFSSCDGRTGGTTCPINSSEHFNITYSSTSVVLTVASGAAPVVGQFKSSGIGPRHITVEPGRFGWGRDGGGRNFALAHLGSQFLASAAVAPPKAGALLFAPQAQSPGLIGTMRSRTMVDFSGGSSLTEAGTFGLETRAVPIPLHRSTFSSTRLPASPRAYLSHGVISAWELASTDSGRRQNVLNRIATFAPARSFSVGTAPHSLMRAGAGSEIHNRINPAAAAMRNNGHTPRMMAPKSLAYHLDLLSILGTSPRQALRGLLGQPGSPNAASLGYLTFSGNR